MDSAKAHCVSSCISWRYLQIFFLWVADSGRSDHAIPVCLWLTLRSAMEMRFWPTTYSYWFVLFLRKKKRPLIVAGTRSCLDSLMGNVNWRGQASSEDTESSLQGDLDEDAGTNTHSLAAHTGSFDCNSAGFLRYDPDKWSETLLAIAWHWA